MNKKIVLLIGIIVLGVTFSGCLNKGTNVKDDKNEKGGITVSSTAGKDGIFEGECQACWHSCVCPALRSATSTSPWRSQQSRPLRAP